MNDIPHVVVLGGGISGLSAAMRLQDLGAERNLRFRITIVEADSRLGGCIETRADDGFLMEMGAESLPAEKPWAIALLDRLGMHDELIEPCAQTRGTLLLRGRRLRRLPAAFSPLAPRSLLPFLTSGVLNPAGIARIALEPFVPAGSPDGDESLASFVTRRLGRNLLDHLAQPLLGGLYSADPRRLSVQATLPQLLEMERRHGSLIRAMRTMKPPVGTRLVTLRGGLGTMVRALETRLGGVRVLRATARSARSLPNGGWIVEGDGTTLNADALVCALPAPSAAEVFAPADTVLAESLRSIRYNSLAVVTLAYRDDEIARLPSAHGVLVPYVERKHVTAITFSSLKYARRAPAGYFLLRAYVGGALQDALLEHGDDAVIAMVRTDLREILGIDAQPLHGIVRRWSCALPEYGVGHMERLTEIERRVSALPNLALAGAAYRGVGVSDCIRSGEAAAEAILASRDVSP